MLKKPRIKVAVAQIRCVPGDVAANLDTHLALIEQARQQGVDLLLFPELSLTGYQLRSRAVEVALDRDAPVIDKLAQAAPDMAVIFGFVEDGPAGQLYNAMACTGGGELRHIHRKINLPTYGALEEGKLYAAGAAVDTFALDHRWDVGTLICADLWNPALVHLAMLAGTTLLLAPINSALGTVGDGFSNPDGWDLNLRFYAMTYGVPILMANRTGQEEDIHFWGGSRILDPYGQTLAMADADFNGLLCAELDYEHVRRARFRLPTLRDSNPSLIAREMARLSAGHRPPNPTVHADD